MTAAVISLLMFGLAPLVAFAQEQVVDTLRTNTRQVKQWGGYVLLVVGAWQLDLGIWADFFAQIFSV